MRASALAAAALIFVLAGCRARPDFGHIILSYAEDNSFCLTCPSFRLEFRDGGHVDYTCLRGCAVPGYRHYVVPTRQFRDTVAAFQQAGFFRIPRTDPARLVVDATVITLTWRDAEKIHEVVDDARELARLTELEKSVKAATGVAPLLRPSAALYRSLVDSGWDVNTAGQDSENALFSAVGACDMESVGFLLEHGSAVTDLTLEMAARSGDADLLRRLLPASPARLDGRRCASLLAQAAAGRSPEPLRFLLDAGCNVNARESLPERLVQRRGRRLA